MAMLNNQMVILTKDTSGHQTWWEHVHAILQFRIFTNSDF